MFIKFSVNKLKFIPKGNYLKIKHHHLALKRMALQLKMPCIWYAPKIDINLGLGFSFTF